MNILLVTLYNVDVSGEPISDHDVKLKTLSRTVRTRGVFVKFRRFFKDAWFFRQTFADFAKSDVKIPIFQRNVKTIFACFS